MSKAKRLKNPTRAQKDIMTEARLNWKNWYVHDEDSLSITVVNKGSRKRRVILK